MAEHTEGPWIVDPDQGQNADGLPVLFVNVPGEDETVCEVQPEPDYDSNDWKITKTTWSRARLIAAAPETKEQRDDLLEALKATMTDGHYNECLAGQRGRGECSAVCQKVRAAIAKATA